MCVAFLFQSGSDFPISFLCIGIIVIVIVALVINSNNKQKAIAQAKAEYEQSLARLKTSPTNPDLRQQTLSLGRTYSNLTRDRKGVTVFDEVALMNDIGAATAGASQPERFVSRPMNVERSMPMNVERSIEERLGRLKDLRSKELIDDREYEKRKKQILDEI